MRASAIAVMLLASGCPNAFLADGIIGKQVRAAVCWAAQVLHCPRSGR